MLLIGCTNMLVKAKKHTYLDYEALPEGAPYQLIKGELIMTPSPIYQHQKLLLKLAMALSAYVDKRALGQVVVSPMDVYLSENDIYQPDIIFISNERKEIIHDRIEGAPDLIIEILSPSSIHYDRVQKMSVYETTNVREYWIVDPQEKSIDVFRNRGKKFVLSAQARSTGRVISTLLGDFEVLLESLFTE